MPDEARPRLRALAGEAADAAGVGDLIRFLDADRRFHTELLGLTGNRTLVQTVLDLRSRSRMYGLVKPASADELVTSAEEHLQLLDALIAGDAGKARDIMLRHLDHVKRT